jgi:hypothetical protein
MVRGAPPFDNAQDPLFRRTIELARDLVDGTLVRMEPDTKRRASKGRHEVKGEV